MRGSLGIMSTMGLESTTVLFLFLFFLFLISFKYRDNWLVVH